MHVTLIARGVDENRECGLAREWFGPLHRGPRPRRRPPPSRCERAVKSQEERDMVKLLLECGPRWTD